jgi:aryl-alcohol dehydrogenase-like predicted oxidoreductase
VTLPTATLGRTGLKVSRLGYGSLELRGPALWGKPVEEAQADRLLNRALDLGITLIDTSPDYGDAEAHIGRAIGHRRDEFVLASKCGCPLTSGDPHDFTPANVRAGVEESLRRLRTDNLDVLQVHLNPTRSEMEAAGTVAELVALRDEGKIRFFGISAELPNVLDHLAMDVFDVFQVPYSALDRDHERLLGTAAAAGAGVIVRGAVARSIEAPPAEVRARLPEAQQDRFDRLAEARLDEVGGGTSTMALLLRFILTTPDVHAVIVGTTDIGHLEANAFAAAEGPLLPEVHAAIGDRLGRPGAVLDGWTATDEA